MRPRFVFLLPIVLAAAACTDDLTIPGPLRRGGVVAVAVSPSPLDLVPGDTARLRASVAVDSGATPTTTWRTSDPTVAVVSSDGLVTARAAGPAAITATSTYAGSSASGSATVTVRPLAGSASAIGTSRP
jgi:uncharacterized protein YjdB